MAALEIIPFKSIGQLIFGDQQLVARAKLCSPFIEMNKAKPSDSDAFDLLGLHLYYDKMKRLEFVEAFDPARVVLTV